MTDFKPLGESYWVEPGKLLAGEHPGHWDKGIVRRRLTGLLDAGIRLFLDLSTPSDGVRPYQAQLEKICRDRGLHAEYLAVPLRENAIPDRRDDVVYALKAIQQALQSQERIYVHCSDGVGRTGMLMGCWLVEQGLDPRHVLDELARRFATMDKSRSHRSTPSSAEQAEWVENWEPMLSAPAAHRSAAS
jgi:hypothetical protein